MLMMTMMVTTTTMMLMMMMMMMTAGEHIRQKPWLQPVTRDPPSAADPQRRPFRKRPFIYV
jgi:hypothetical protein